MMTSMPAQLNDDGARFDAIGRHSRSILVEAGAGSGKTAVMAGRIAVMLAEGTSPRAIAAVTFTELAASELLSRVREFVADLSEGRIAPELKVALSNGLSDAQRDNLVTASAAIDEVTCSTIHGFCQRLIKPYPAEADIDPGATVMDRNLADLAFLEIVDGWLRERLSGEQGGIIAEMVLYNPKSTVELIHKIAASLRGRRTLKAPTPSPFAPLMTEFQNASTAFGDFIKNAAAHEPETAVYADGFAQMAEGVGAVAEPQSPAGLVQLLVARPHPDVCTKTGGFAAYRKKGKWGEAAKQAGLSKADGEQLNIAADDLYAKCCTVWVAMQQAVASHVLAALVAEAAPILERYRDYKRSSAQLDFDDLIYAARDLLRSHEAVRQALGKRFAHVLVDEFQDTDPLQTEIFWRLCGDPQNEGDDWAKFQIRPGALFLVGDPKQAIYRFRGADVGAYVQARSAFVAQSQESLLSISTNFRSCASILTFVNARFETVLSADGQPGFAALEAFHSDPDESLCVAALDVAVAGEDGKAKVEQQRDGEAEAVADICARLIGHREIIDRRTGTARLCQPGDIALLAPTGAELWRYEEALERRGIPVATQAGKGLFRRQEIQDLIAITRILADRRDTLALGALLRGPLVGLTDEELLDIVWALPRSDNEPDRLPRLTLSVDADTIAHDLARAVVVKLQALARRTNSTTPHELLSQAIDVLRVRPVLVERHRGQAERALANVDLYLSLATAYAVRGLRSFSEAMTSAWEDEARAVEGRPDAQEEAISLFTMHAAKGLEWPIVIPINTMTGVMSPDSAVVDRQSDTFYCPIFGVPPEGHEAAIEAEKLELDRERSPLALLQSVERMAGRMAIYCDRGRIKEARPNAARLMALYEKTITEVSAPAGGAFHPKVWCIRFQPERKGMPIRMRLAILSRNLTNDRCWDLALCLDGTVKDDTCEDNEPVVGLLRALPALANAANRPAAPKFLPSLLRDLARCWWDDLPAGATKIRFAVNGLEAGAWSPQRGERIAILSPFVSSNALKQLASGYDDPAACQLVARAEELDCVKPAIRGLFEIQTLDDRATEYEEEDRDEACSADLDGLHAKAYVVERGSRLHIHLGSANATTSALVPTRGC